MQHAYHPRYDLESLWRYFEPQIERRYALAANVFARMRLEIVVRPQQYALLLRRPRDAIAVDQLLADILRRIARRRYRRGVVRADLETARAGVCVWCMRHAVRSRILFPCSFAQRLVTRLGLLALAHPRDFAQGAQHTSPVVEAVAIQDARRARAGRNGVGRCERVRRHGGGKERGARAYAVVTKVETWPFVSAWRFGSDGDGYRRGLEVAWAGHDAVGCYEAMATGISPAGAVGGRCLFQQHGQRSHSYIQTCAIARQSNSNSRFCVARGAPIRTMHMYDARAGA